VFCSSSSSSATTCCVCLQSFDTAQGLWAGAVSFCLHCDNYL
jgi:hypothetical protein